jgi:hypothetical protein
MRYSYLHKTFFITRKLGLAQFFMMAGVATEANYMDR